MAWNGCDKLTMKTKITLGEILACDHNLDGWKKLIVACGTANDSHVVDLREILSIIGPHYAWFVTQCLPRRERVSLGLRAAETVAHICTDPLIAKCLDTIRAWIEGTVTDSELYDCYLESMSASVRYRKQECISPVFEAVAMSARALPEAAAWASDEAAAAKSAKNAEEWGNRAAEWHASMAKGLMDERWEKLGGIMRQWCDEQDVESVCEK